MLDEANVGFVTRLQPNASDDGFVKERSKDWVRIYDDISYQFIEGNLGRKRYVFRSEVRRTFVLSAYHRKAERDYEEMEIISKGTDAGKKPRKKYRNSNCFVNTHLSYQFPLKAFTKEQAIDHAVNGTVSGREGLFVLTTNRDLTAGKVLELYRARSQVENAFRDLKHGIDWRPAGCTSEMDIKGRILISFLALFCMSMVTVSRIQEQDS